MTIIAGFRCTNGIVLCSDSELTYGESFKSPFGAKIVRSYEPAYCLISAAAGYIDYAEALWEALLSELDKSDKQFETIRESIAENLKRFYYDHIYPANRDELSIRLLMGLRTKDGKIELFKSAESALLTGDAYEIAGSGAPLGNYLVQTLTGRKPITVDEGEIVAVQVVKQAKTFVPYCGGKTQIWILHSDGRLEQPSPDRIEAIEGIWMGVDQAFGPTMIKKSAELISLLDKEAQKNPK